MDHPHSRKPPDLVQSDAYAHTTGAQSTQWIEFCTRFFNISRQKRRRRASAQPGWRARPTSSSPFTFRCCLPTPSVTAIHTRPFLRCSPGNELVTSPVELASSRSSRYHTRRRRSTSSSAADSFLDPSPRRSYTLHPSLRPSKPTLSSTHVSPSVTVVPPLDPLPSSVQPCLEDPPVSPRHPPLSPISDPSPLARTQTTSLSANHPTRPQPGPLSSRTRSTHPTGFPSQRLAEKDSIRASGGS